jgi:effector-binding domain-containing protein
MKTLIKIFYWVMGIVALLIIVSLLLPKTYKVDRMITIHAKPGIIYGLTSNFKLWHLWVPWTKEVDSSAVFTMAGAAAQVGTSWKWDGKILGNGEMVCTSLLPGQLVAYDLAFDNGKYRSKGKITIESQGDSTNVSWIDEGDLGYNPVGRYMGLFMDRMMGPDFEKGLAKLKAVAESRKAWPQVEETYLNKQVVLVVRDSAGPKTYSMVMSRAYGEIMEFVQSNKLNVNGPAFSIALKWDSATMSSVMDIGMPVEKAATGKGRVQVMDFPEQKVVMAHYFGPYEKIAFTYNVLDQYIKETDNLIVGAPWEIYITDPMTEKDTLKWETRVAFPIK